MNRVLLGFGLLCLVSLHLSGAVEVNPQFALHESDEITRIRTLLFRNVTKGLAQPRLCFLVGGIGSGKSTALRKLVAQEELIEPKDRVRLGYTRIMRHLDGWNSTDHCTSPTLHGHAKDLQDMFFEEAVRGRTNILFEGPLSDPDRGRAMMDFALARNYIVNVVGASLNVHTAATRAIQQWQTTGHWSSLHEIVASHQGIAKAFPSFLRPKEVNCTLLYDTTVPRHPALVLRDSAILLPQQFADFLARASITEEEVRDELNEQEADAFHSLCDCQVVSDVDEAVCHSQHDRNKDHKKSRNRWRAAAITFIGLSGLLAIGIMVMGIRFFQEYREQQRAASYPDERFAYQPQPRQSPPAPVAGSGYARMADTA